MTPFTACLTVLLFSIAITVFANDEEFFSADYKIREVMGGDDDDNQIPTPTRTPAGTPTLGYTHTSYPSDGAPHCYWGPCIEDSPTRTPTPSTTPFKSESRTPTPSTTPTATPTRTPSIGSSLSSSPSHIVSPIIRYWWKLDQDQEEEEY